MRYTPEAIRASAHDCEVQAMPGAAQLLRDLADGLALTFDEFTERTVPRKTPDGPPLLWAAGLGGEAGEVMEAAVAVVVHAGRAQDATKKIERDRGGPNMRGEVVDRDEELRKECGNVLFYLDRLLRSRGMTLEGAARAQIEAMEGPEIDGSGYGRGHA